MTSIKKDHFVGAGTGAVAGGITGAAVGAVGGPIGMGAGLVVGGIAGAVAGDNIAEAVNPTDYADYWKTNYKSASYLMVDRGWDDYEPAYKLGYSAHGSNAGRKFEDVESSVASTWEATKGKSRLAWNEAKGAVRDGWNYLERAIPGDSDHDGN
jgi:hypothetical protein